MQQSLETTEKFSYDRDFVQSSRAYGCALKYRMNCIFEGRSNTALECRVRPVSVVENYEA